MKNDRKRNASRNDAAGKNGENENRPRERARWERLHARKRRKLTGGRVQAQCHERFDKLRRGGSSKRGAEQRRR